MLDHYSAKDAFIAYAKGPLLALVVSQGFDQSKGLFHERISANSTPLDLGYTRLVSQCRQVITCVLAGSLAQNAEALELGTLVFQNICKHFYEGPKRGWRFALGSPPLELPLAETPQLYAHAFVILAAALLYQQSGQAAALEIAEETAQFVSSNFAVAGGYASVLSPELKANPLGLREQNPHMHLLEGALFAYAVSAKPLFRRLAEDLVALLKSKLIQNPQGTLTEYLNSNWQPDPHKGAIVEPGHHFEWAWLLLRYQEILGRSSSVDSTPTNNAENLATAEKLLSWAIKYGIDPEFGGIYDELSTQADPLGAPLDPVPLSTTKRIWPLLEAVKSLEFARQAQLLDSVTDSATLNTTQNNLLNLLLTKYLNLESGTWQERLTRALSVHTDYLPATTPYHIAMAAYEMHHAQVATRKAHV